MATQLRWGVLGAANVARTRVIPAMQLSSNSRVVALASRGLEKARTVAGPLGIDRVYGDYDELLADSSVDAVYIPVPNSLHARWTIRAAEAGKAVLCEKPLAMTAAEAGNMVAACARRDVPLMEAFMYRFHPQFARVRALVDQGGIGAVGQVRAGMGFRMDPINPDNVRLRQDLGGGALMDVGCYTVNAVRAIFNEEPVRVTAWHDVDRRFGVDMTCAGVLEFSEQRFATIDCSFRPGYNGWYMIVGSEGTVEVPRAFTPRLAHTEIILTDSHGHRHYERIAGVDHYRLMVEAFAAAVLEGAPLPYPPSDAVGNMKVLDAMKRAAAHNKPERVA